MGRWSHLDSDEERLPAGMSRVGYDADTQVYTYRDSTDGSLWEGAPGCKYGKLHRVQNAAPPLPSVWIPDNRQQPPYPLHDYDDDDYYSDGNNSYTHGDADEKFTTCNDKKKQPEPALGTPPKAKLQNPYNPQQPHRSHPQPAAPGKPLPDLRTKLSGTTLGESTTSTPTSDSGTADSQGKPAPLKRTGTLSRIKRFLSSSSLSSLSSSSSASARDRPASRRGTDAGQNQAQTSALAGQTAGAPSRPGSGSGSGSGPGPVGAGGGAPRKRATTFDEILGVEPRR